MSDLISRDALIMRFKQKRGNGEVIDPYRYAFYEAIRLTEDAPSVEFSDSVRVIGKWEKKQHKEVLPGAGITISGQYPTCSICGFAEMGLAQGTNFCPNCGADMRGDNNG